MRRITFTAGIDNHSSYGFHAQAILSSLCELPDVFTSVRAIRTQERYGQKIPDWIMERIVQCPQPEIHEILLCPPDKMMPTPRKRTAFITMHESTKLSPNAVDFLNRAFVVIVPCQWNAAVFSAFGVTVPIRVVPLGVDDRAFNPKPPHESVVTFGAAGRMTHGFQRKGIKRVIDLFLQAFQCVNDVKLKIKCYPDDPLLEYDDPRIEVTRDFLTPKQLADWYANLTAFVSLSTGGWELMPHQAMACARPVIASKFGGTAEYFNESIGYEVPFRIVPAEDSWKGLGHWAEPIGEQVIEAMRYVYDNPREAQWKGEKASIAVRDLNWTNSNAKLQEVLRECDFLPSLKPVIPLSKPMTIEHVSRAADGLTVAITNFHRPKHLERAIKSVTAAGVKNIVVASMEHDEAVTEVISAFPQVKFACIGTDLGCNELWLQAAYRAQTKHVLILHDDDTIAPQFGAVYESQIAPFMRSGGVVTWRGQVVWDNGKVHPTEYWHGGTRELDVKELEKFLLTKGRLSLSPIVTVFDRDVLIGALKEAHQHLTAPECLLHPGMLLGTEILAHLRNAQRAKKWLYIAEVLSNYGAHEGSGTVKAQSTGDLSELVKGYDFAREHFIRLRNVDVSHDPRIIFIYNDYHAHDKDEERRHDYAMWTWQFHFDQGTMLSFPIWNEDLKRTSAEMQDPRPVPFIRDLIERGMVHAQPEDIVVFANRDICLTTTAADRIRAHVHNGGLGIAAIRRRNMPHPKPDQRFRTVIGCKPDGGYDVFAFTPRWWQEHGGKIPDMLIGREAWDTVVRYIGEGIAGDRIYLDDVTYHENHGSFWLKDRMANPGQLHNRTIASKYLSEHGRPPLQRKHQFLKDKPPR